MTWFVGGAVAGVAGVGVAKRKMKQAATQLTPKRSSTESPTECTTPTSKGSSPSERERAELRGRMDGTAHSLADHLDEGDWVLVDGRPVEPGQVIVLKQIRDRNGDRGRRRA